jgi:hypothetical protein
VATWGATGAGVATGHRHLARGFLDAVQDLGGVGKATESEPSQTLLGEAVYGGLARLYVEAPTNRDLIDTYILFGDPAMRINRYTGDAYTAYAPLVAR